MNEISTLVPVDRQLLIESISFCKGLKVWRSIGGRKMIESGVLRLYIAHNCQ